MKFSDLKIVFFGTPEFAVASLETLIAAGANICAVVTMPDKVGGRGNKIIESAVKKCALAHSLPVLQPEKLSDEDFLDTLRSYHADLFIVIAFRMLPRKVWQMPPMGTFNLHASLLPQYRGAAPINRAIMNGEKESGVTTFLLKHEIDTGDILMQERVEIGPDEDFGSLYDRLMAVGSRLTLATVTALAEGTSKPVPQDELLGGNEPTPAPKIFHEDCKIDWTWPASQVHNLVRGLSPIPGAWCELTLAGETGVAETTLKIQKTRIAEGLTLKAGQIYAKDGKVFAGCGSGAVELVMVQPSGKRLMEASAWYNGIRSGKSERSPWLK